MDLLRGTSRVETLVKGASPFVSGGSPSMVHQVWIIFKNSPVMYSCIALKTIGWNQKMIFSSSLKLVGGTAIFQDTFAAPASSVSLGDRSADGQRQPRERMDNWWLPRLCCLFMFVSFLGVSFLQFITFVFSKTGCSIPEYA